MFFRLALFLFFLLGLGEAKEQDTHQTIAFVQDDMSNDFRRAQVYEAMQEAKKHKNIRFVYSDAGAKKSLLVRQLDTFIAENVDLIIIGTNDSDIVVPSIERAFAQGIGIIVLDRKINTDKYTSYIKSDNYAIGVMAAKYLLSQMKKGGTILMLQGFEGNNVATERTNGFIDTISKHKNFKVIKKRGNYLRKDTIFVMEELHKKGIHYDAIYSHSDSMLSGVRTFYAKHKLDSKALLSIGVDYTSEAQSAIMQGTQDASILFALGGKESVQVALDFLHKKQVTQTIINPIKLITKENAPYVQPIF
ncbi:MAG: substrate-binding domain-containing protein [Sulfurimonas sp.]|jgi:ribose transport system substrate-binding protein|nr:substrate-binding domain-containing protein [Sulfurimonas sp.]